MIEKKTVTMKRRMDYDLDGLNKIIVELHQRTATLASIIEEVLCST